MTIPSIRILCGLAYIPDHHKSTLPRQSQSNAGCVYWPCSLISVWVSLCVCAQEEEPGGTACPGGDVIEKICISGLPVTFELWQMAGIKVSFIIYSQWPPLAPMLAAASGDCCHGLTEGLTGPY
jgi:hypothetical protein